MSERRRLYHERTELEERQERGNPISFDEIGETTRKKIGRRVLDRIVPSGRAQAELENDIARALRRHQRQPGEVLSSHESA